MIHLELLFFAQIREVTGVRTTGAVLPDGSRLIDLIEHLTAVYGKNFGEKIESIDGLRILINGREYYLLGGMEAPLAENDTVIFLPPIAGG